MLTILNCIPQIININKYKLDIVFQSSIVGQKNSNVAYGSLVTSLSCCHSYDMHEIIFTGMCLDRPSKGLLGGN